MARAAKSAGLLVSLPSGQARITIEAPADVRRAAGEWLEVVELLAGSSLTAAGLRAQLDDPDASAALPSGAAIELDAAGARPASARAADAVHAEAVGWQLRTLVQSYDVTQVAARLGVDPTRVRQRLRAGTLLGLRAGGRAWRLPRFQFDAHGRDLPHLGLVLAALPADAHWRSVEGFFERPKPELIADGEASSPREWLLGGGPAEPVVALAAALPA